MKLTTACSPHIRGAFRTNRIMMDVVLALLPALLVGVYVQGIRVVLLALISTAAAVATEYFYCLVTKKRNTVVDCSAIVTGLLLAMTLPVSVPYYVPVIGSAFAILFVKAMFGGLGQNVFNPALSARALLVLIFPGFLTRFPGVDGVTGATPLHDMIMGHFPQESLLDMFLGNCPGAVGEASALALLLGGGYLVARKVISIRIPGAYLGTVAILTLIFHKLDAPLEWMLYNLLSGGVMLGAIFMATDYATSPVAPMGQIVYGIGCGVLTVIFRYFGIFPEGVTYAILIMNACVWSIDRLCAPRRFGTKKGAKA